MGRRTRIGWFALAAIVVPRRSAIHRACPSVGPAVPSARPAEASAGARCHGRRRRWSAGPPTCAGSTAAGSRPRARRNLGANAGIRADAEPWTPDNPSDTTPRALYGPLAASNNRANSDRWIEDGSYLRVQNVELGYRVPFQALGQRIGAPNATLRVYASVENALTLTGYSNWDPATPGQGALAPAVDDIAIYPAARTFTFGVDASF